MYLRAFSLDWTSTISILFRAGLISSMDDSASRRLGFWMSLTTSSMVSLRALSSCSSCFWNMASTSSWARIRSWIFCPRAFMVALSPLRAFLSSAEIGMGISAMMAYTFSMASNLLSKESKALFIRSTTSMLATYSSVDLGSKSITSLRTLASSVKSSIFSRPTLGRESWSFVIAFAMLGRMVRLNSRRSTCKIRVKSSPLYLDKRNN